MKKSDLIETAGYATLYCLFLWWFKGHQPEWWVWPMAFSVSLVIRAGGNAWRARRHRESA